MPEPDLLTSGRERAPSRSRRRVLGAVLTLGLLAAGGVLLARHDVARPGTAGAPHPVAAATGGTAVAGAAHALEQTPVLSISGDLTTTVSVGHVRSTAVDGDAHAALVEHALQAAQVGGHFVMAPQAGSTAADPKGVEVLFDRRLDDRAVGAFVRAVEALPATTAFVTEEPGTTVDVSAPLVPGSGCEPAGSADPAGGPGQAFAGWFPLFDLSRADGRVVLSYAGPAKTPEQLFATASFLARLCHVEIDDVRVTRHEGTTR